MSMNSVASALLAVPFALLSCFVASAGDPPEFQQPHQGSIKLMESGSVRIHVSKSGIFDFRKGQSIFVYRDGYSVAAMKVSEPTESGCIAKIDSQTDDANLRNGGGAILDTTRSFLESVQRHADFDATELAEKYANADLEIGLRRIMDYGQPADPPQQNRDFESRLPIHVVARDRISPTLIKFIDEYNQVVRQRIDAEQEKSERDEGSSTNAEC